METQDSIVAEIVAAAVGSAITTIAALITRGVEKRRLRRKGILMDKEEEHLKKVAQMANES